jgi:S-adenosylmethionine-dependent methyltransferase
VAGDRRAGDALAGDGAGGARAGGGTVAGERAAGSGALARHGGPHGDPRTAVVREVLQAEVLALVARSGRARLDIVDAGGGTGGFAVPLAAAGHNVTVVDPSPNSLAAAQRRAAEMSVPLRAVQGDAADLAMLAGRQSADLVLCHSVLEYVESPAAAMSAIAGVLRPGGTVSVLAASAVATVIHRALAGRFTEARRLLTGISAGPAQPPGGAAVPGTGPRSFTLAVLTRLIRDSGLQPGAAHGARVFTDLVAGIAADADPPAAQALLALEKAASAHPAFHDFAAHIHVLGHRGA